MTHENPTQRGMVAVARKEASHVILNLSVDFVRAYGVLLFSSFQINILRRASSFWPTGTCMAAGLSDELNASSSYYPVESLVCTYAWLASHLKTYISLNILCISSADLGYFAS